MNLSRSNFAQWHRVLLERLTNAGNTVGVGYATSGGGRSLADLLVAMEPRRFGSGLAYRADAPEAVSVSDPAVTIELGGGALDGRTTFGIGQGGEVHLGGLPALLVGGGQPHLVVRLGGRAVAEAYPMVRDRLWLARALEDVLARVITLIEGCVRDFGAGRLAPIAVTEDPPGPSGLVGTYLPRLASGVLSRAIGRRTHHGFYWRTGYRVADRRGVVDTNSLEGKPWTVLPDDGKRFYADPFLFERGGRTYLFVEDYPYAIKRGLVSVAELQPDNTLTTPRAVLDEPWHLSYPQVFARDGEVWMIPETSAEKKLWLYRAESFPDRWVRERVLIDDAELSDATLLEHEGRLWLFAAGRDGYGSGSDMMVVHSAPRLTGPWTPHRRNPVLIDCRRARPGGNFISSAGKLFLPVQDGSQRYGGGLGFAELTELDDAAVRFAMPIPVTGAPTWSADGLHTYNRAGGLEVVDGFAELKR